MSDHESHGRLLARLVRVLLAREPCETLPDLTEALKVECARLHIRWTPDAISAAYRLIASNTPLPGAGGRGIRPLRTVNRTVADVGTDSCGRPYGPLERLDPRPLSRAEAAALWRTLCAALVRAQATGARHARGPR
jgi:hypothetical protein